MLRIAFAFMGCFLANCTVASPPVFRFSPDVLDSVVGVVPEWRGAAPRSRAERPEVTAVAVLPGGYLATNVHVIGDAERLKVRLADGRMLAAGLVGIDRLSDIALIRAPLDLPVLEIGAAPALGGRVCAIGNQFGLGLSVTCGVVSAVHRSGVGFNPIEDFIQTDAVVNPGGSGGALVDGEGRLVGLVSAIFTKDSDANIGVNFAASMRLVMRVVEDLAKHGRVLRGKSGLMVADLGIGERAELVGARIVRVDQGGAAQSAGLAVGDVIVSVGGRAIRKASGVTSALHMHRIGEPFAVGFVRGGEHRATTIELRP